MVATVWNACAMVAIVELARSWDKNADVRSG